MEHFHGHGHLGYGYIKLFGHSGPFLLANHFLGPFPPVTLIWLLIDLALRPPSYDLAYPCELLFLTFLSWTLSGMGAETFRLFVLLFWPSKASGTLSLPTLWTSSRIGSPSSPSPVSFSPRWFFTRNLSLRFVVWIIWIIFLGHFSP